MIKILGMLTGLMIGVVYAFFTFMFFETVPALLALLVFTLAFFVGFLKNDFFKLGFFLLTAWLLHAYFTGFVEYLLIAVSVLVWIFVGYNFTDFKIYLSELDEEGLR